MGSVFKITMKDEARVKCMKHKDLVIHVLPEKWQQIEQWCKTLNVAYAGQGLPAISFQVLQHLMKTDNQREIITGEEKCAILEQYRHRCAECGSRGKLQFDHIVRHSESYGGAKELQPLCEPCHLQKTTANAET